MIGWLVFIRLQRCTEVPGNRRRPVTAIGVFIGQQCANHKFNIERQLRNFRILRCCQISMCSSRNLAVKSLHFRGAALLALAAWPLATLSAEPMSAGQIQGEPWVLAQMGGGPCVPGTSPFNTPAANPCPPGYAPLTTPGLVISPSQPPGTPGAAGTTGIGVTPGVGPSPGIGTPPGVGAASGIGSAPLIDSTSGLGGTAGLGGSNGVGGTTGNNGLSPLGGSNSLGGPMGTNRPGSVGR